MTVAKLSSNGPMNVANDGGWHGFGGEDHCDDYGAVPGQLRTSVCRGLARRRGRPRCGVAAA